MLLSLAQGRINVIVSVTFCFANLLAALELALNKILIK